MRAWSGGCPAGPDAGFFGRDETLLALDRAFDGHRVVLLHAWAGAGKTSTALEFARWYALTGGTAGVLFTSFEHHLTMARLLDQVGSQFGSALEGAGIQWDTLDDAGRRDVALQVLAQVPVLWIWDNIEPVAGFPAGTDSAWTPAEQDELAGFLRVLDDQTRCKVLLTSRRDERGWLGDLPARVALPPMPMLERLELARAIASRQPGGAQAFLEVEDWRPLLAFTQGNPLTITILTRQALRGHHTSKAQIQDFVEQLRAGAATVTDDAAQGRGASLAASLDYGFTQAFTDPERAALALLALFQGFTSIDTLRAMGAGDDPVPAVAGLDRQAGIALLDRAADVGLLTAHGDGYYAVHPAIPWHLHALFQQHYGPDGSPPALHAARAWTTATSRLGDYYIRQYEEGHTLVIGVLGAEEANLLHARRLALTHHWHNLIIGPMQGLRTLYQHTGRAVEWRRLVAELVPVFTDPGTGSPRPGREQQWAILTSYRVRIARVARDWPAAEQLQHAVIAWQRERAAAALAIAPGELDHRQRTQIRNLTVAMHDLGHLLREQDDPGCVQPYQEAIELSHRVGDRRAEASAAFNLGHVYNRVRALRDLDQAEQWYRRCLELLDEHDTLGRATRHRAARRHRPRAVQGCPGRRGTRRAATPAPQRRQPTPTTRRSACSRTMRSANSLRLTTPWATSTARPGTSLLPSGTTRRPSTTASARTTATAPAGPGTPPPPPSPAPGASTTRCSTPAPPCATTRPSAPAPPPGPTGPASSSPALKQEPVDKHNTGAGDAT